MIKAIEEDYKVVTVCVRVAEVVEGGTKKEFYDALRKSLDKSRTIANLVVAECVKQDDFTQKKPPKIYTYQAVKHLGYSTMVAAVCRGVELEYKRERFMMLIGRKSLRCYRSWPWPLLRSGGISFQDHGEYVTAKIRLDDKFWIVRLRSGSNYRDQIAAVRNCINNGELLRDSEIGLQGGVAVIRVGYRREKAKPSFATGVMLVSTSKKHLLACSKQRSKVPFVYNCDDLFRWKAEARNRIQRLRQDKKFGSCKSIALEEMARISQKMQNRLKTLCHQAAKYVVDKAIRLRCAEIRFDGTIRSYCDEFPWFDLIQKLKDKCDQAGIAFVDVSLSFDRKLTGINDPHVYFAYSPTRKQVKIGKTSKADLKRIKQGQTWCPDAVYLAIVNCTEEQLTQLENYYHSQFAIDCLYPNMRGQEWFDAESVIAHLREAGLFGNAGNLSQIKQVLEVS